MTNPYDPQQPADEPRPEQPPTWPSEPDDGQPQAPSYGEPTQQVPSADGPATQPLPSSSAYGAPTPPDPPAGGYGTPEGGYGAPQGGAPQGPYGPPPGGYGPTGPSGQGQQGTNGLAVAAVISGVLGFLCLTAVAAVVLGIVALGQIRGTGRRGRGLAITGIVLGVLWMLGAIVAVPVAINAFEDEASPTTTAAPATSPETTTSETTSEPPEETTTEPVPDTAVLVVGDCVDDPAIIDGSDVPESAVVDCSTPHYAEAYAQFDLPEGDFPGEEAVTTAAEEGCDTEFETFVGMPYQESVLEVFYYYPTEEVWAFDRSVVCILIDPSGEPVTGTLQGANR